MTNSNTTGSSETATIPIVTSEKFCLMIGTLPNSSPAPTHRPTQAAGAHQVVEPERRGRHAGGAGDEGHERADDRHEAPQDDRLAAVLLEERMRALEMFPIEQAMRNPGAILGAEHARADERPTV